MKFKTFNNLFVTFDFPVLNVYLIFNEQDLKHISGLCKFKYLINYVMQ